MIDDMVMRSVYMTPRQDAQLRQLAFETNCMKADLIRAAIPSYLETILTPGIPVKDLKAAIASPEAYVEVKNKLGVYLTVGRRIPRRTRAKAHRPSF